MTITIVPDGWERPLGGDWCGHFWYHGSLCFKSEYDDYFTESGKAFWGGTSTAEERAKIVVQPVRVEIDEGLDGGEG